MEAYAVQAEAMAYEAKRPWKPAEVESAEAFRVDDLLDFSNEEIAGPIGEDDLQLSDHSADSSITVAEQASNCSPISEKARDAIPSILEEEDLHVTCEDMEQLEWLSTFVEESFSTDEAIKPPSTSPPWGSNHPNISDISSNNKEESFQVMSPLSVLESSATSGMAVPGSRARSKRSRAEAPCWPSRLLSSNSTCPSFDSISINFPAIPSFLSFDCPALSAETEFLTPEDWGDDCLHLPKKPSKIMRRKTVQDSAPRRCSHCLAQRTPQWRAGPMGPKTLCNACGVRFKSGRLLPEYRPAGSPTFVFHRHSNSHRKVLEMRRQKQQEEPVAHDPREEEEEEDDEEEEEEHMKLSESNSNRDSESLTGTEQTETSSQIEDREKNYEEVLIQETETH